MWPDVTTKVLQVKDGSMEFHHAAAKGRHLRYGWRSHVIVRETEDEARDRGTSTPLQAGRRRRCDHPPALARLRRRRASPGRPRSASEADDEGYVERHLWTGVGRARSGAGAAIVGDPDQVTAKIHELIDAGIEAFILSGYPHAAECDLFARHVLPEHRPRSPRVHA